MGDKKKKGRTKIVLPRRQPTLIIPPREIVYVTADKLTCTDCTCFPKGDVFVKNRKLNPCLKLPLTLYELAAVVVDSLRFPEAFLWSEAQAADWMEKTVGLPQYRSCILDNHIDGRRLLRFADPSHCPETNIRHFTHIQMITAKIRELFGTEFLRFSRSVGLPPRKPLTHCTWFRSRTGPSWGIRQNWTRTDIFRWMKILDPEPVHMDHWDLAWHMKPDFPKTLYGRKRSRFSGGKIPRYVPPTQVPCPEYMVPRRFPLHREIPDQEIWMERAVGSPRQTETEWLAAEKEKEAAWRSKKYVPTRPKPSRLDPPVINLAGLRGNTLLLARRLMPKKKFL